MFEAACGATIGPSVVFSSLGQYTTGLPEHRVDYWSQTGMPIAPVKQGKTNNKTPNGVSNPSSFTAQDAAPAGDCGCKPSTTAMKHHSKHNINVDTKVFHDAGWTLSKPMPTGSMPTKATPVHTTEFLNSDSKSHPGQALQEPNAPYSNSTSKSRNDTLGRTPLSGQDVQHAVTHDPTKHNRHLPPGLFVPHSLAQSQSQEPLNVASLLQPASLSAQLTALSQLLPLCDLQASPSDHTRGSSPAVPSSHSSPSLLSLGQPQDRSSPLPATASEASGQSDERRSPVAAALHSQLLAQAQRVPLDPGCINPAATLTQVYALAQLQQLVQFNSTQLLHSSSSRPPARPQAVQSSHRDGPPAPGPVLSHFQKLAGVPASAPPSDGPPQGPPVSHPPRAASRSSPVHQLLANVDPKAPSDALFELSKLLSATPLELLAQPRPTAPDAQPPLKRYASSTVQQPDTQPPLKRPASAGVLHQPQVPSSARPPLPRPSSAAARSGTTGVDDASNGRKEDGQLSKKQMKPHPPRVYSPASGLEHGLECSGAEKPAALCSAGCQVGDASIAVSEAQTGGARMLLSAAGKVQDLEMEPGACKYASGSNNHSGTSVRLAMRRNCSEPGSPPSAGDRVSAPRALSLPASPPVSEAGPSAPQSDTAGPAAWVAPGDVPTSYKPGPNQTNNGEAVGQGEGTVEEREPGTASRYSENEELLGQLAHAMTRCSRRTKKRVKKVSSRASHHAEEIAKIASEAARNAYNRARRTGRTCSDAYEVASKLPVVTVVRTQQPSLVTPPRSWGASAPRNPTRRSLGEDARPKNLPDDCHRSQTEEPRQLHSHSSRKS